MLKSRVSIFLQVALAFFLSVRTGAAQVRAHDKSQAAEVATSAIGGRVVDGHTGRGLSRARVRLEGPGGLRLTTLTDQAGNFAFTALSAGRYVLNADKSTYLPARYPESGSTLRNTQRLLPLLEGQVRTMTVPLFHGGAIQGRVVDSQGEPVEFASV